MGHSEDDAVHKIPHKMKTHWQNQIKISVLVQLKILCRIRYINTDFILVQCPFNAKPLTTIFQCSKNYDTCNEVKSCTKHGKLDQSQREHIP